MVPSCCRFLQLRTQLRDIRSRTPVAESLLARTTKHLHGFCFFTAELYLKCYLLAEGFTLKEVGGRELGHNVFSLSEKCADNGLKIARDYREILEKIQNWDSAIQTRYLKIGIRKEIVTDALYATCCYLHRKTAYFAYNDYPSLPRPALQQLTTSELSQLGLQE